MSRTNHQGTTLLELAIVVAIIGILSVTALQYYTNTRVQAIRLKALEDMQNIKQAIQRFRRSDHQPHGMNYTMRRPTSAVELVKVRFPDAQETATIHLLEKVPKTPWGRDYNIDLYNVLAWSTDEQNEYYKGLRGRMLKVPYTDIHTDSFEGVPISTDAWQLITGGNATWAQASGAVFLSAPHTVTKDDHAFMVLKKSLLLKGLGGDGTTSVEVSRNLNVEWGTVIQVNFEFYQESASNAVSLVAGHAMDVDPAVESLDMMGGIYLWPRSGGLPVAPLSDPLDATSAKPAGIMFSNRNWRIQPMFSSDPIVDLDTKEPVGDGGWGPGYHEIRFVSKYDSMLETWLMDVSIDGDRKGTIPNLSAVNDDEFYLVLGADLYMNPLKETPTEMVIHSVTVSTIDFSSYYRDHLWKDSNTYGRK